jgi:surface protein
MTSNHFIVCFIHIFISISCIQRVIGAPMILSIAVDSVPAQFTLPLGTAPSVNVWINWGDGVQPIIYTGSSVDDARQVAALFTTFSTVKTYNITIGDQSQGLNILSRFGWNDNGLGGWGSLPGVRLLGIYSFGDLATTSLRGALLGAGNVFLPPVLPSTVTDVGSMFSGATTVPSTVSNWNVAAVTKMDRMFFNCPVPTTISLASWNVAAVVDMTSMFEGSTTFNSDISGWTVSAVTAMDRMFYKAQAFNRNLGAWVVSKSVSFTYMFANTTFNPNVASWQLNSARNLGSMFEGNTAFNAPIADWNVSKVTNFRGMFFGSRFNQPINTWNTGSATDMSYMFDSNSAFNQSLDQWNTTTVTSMTQMFRFATAFSYSIANWCVPRIPTLPAGFIDGTSYPSRYVPQWGSCPSAPQLPPPVTVSPPTSAPQPPPLAAPVASPQAVCPGAPPVIGAVCLNGRWTINGTIGPNTTEVVVPGGVTIIIVGPAQNRNVTVSVIVNTNTGRIDTSECVDVGGQLRLLLGDISSVKTGDKITIITSTNPNCFNVSLTPVVQSGNTDPCRGAVVTATPSVQKDISQASYSVIFTVTDSSGTPSCANNSGNTGGPSGELSGGAIAGISVAIVVVILGIGGTIFYINKRSRDAKIKHAQDLLGAHNQRL